MNCPNCQTEVQANAKFCTECGTNLENLQTNACAQCGETLKEGARFCHNCGSALASGDAPIEEHVYEGAQVQNQSWLHSFGAFLFIPIFAGIIVLLFWVNREPEPLSASNTGNAGQGAPDMAAMQNVHETLDRLQKKIEAEPRDVVSIDSLAIMYSIAGSYDKALMYYEKHLEIEPDKSEVKIALGLTYHNLKRNDDAIRIIQEVLAKEPTNAFALHYLAEIYSSMHKHDEAGALWQKIVDAYPGTEMAKMAEQRIQESLEQEN
ncbi:MAG: zinc-ribbon domain-containing protein [bacterium]